MMIQRRFLKTSLLLLFLIAFFSINMLTASADSISNNLVFNLSFPNGQITDSGPDHYTITNNGGVTTYQLPSGEWAAHFDGTNYLSVADADNLSFIDNIFTIDAWVKFNSTDNEAIISKCTPGYEYDISDHTVDGNPWLTCVVYNQSGWNVYNNYNLVYDNSYYTHYLITSDGSYMYLYRDGYYMDKEAKDATNNMANTNAPLTIGKSAFGGYLNGSLMQVRMYHQYFDKELVYQAFNDKVKYVPAAPGTVAAAFTFDDWYLVNHKNFASTYNSYNVNPTFFVTDLYTNTSMIQLLHSSVPGAEFGGHTVNHTPETGYDTHIADYMNNEVIPNKAYLANAVGSSIVGFAYPGGFHSVTSDTAILNNYSYVRYTGYTDTLGQFPTGYANQPYVNYQTQTKLYAANAQDSIIKNGNTDNVNLSLSIARLRGQSIVYYMHNLSYDGYSDDQTITAANLTAIIVYAHDNNIQMVNLKQIAYIPVPAANFSVSSFSGINNRTVTYTDLSTGTINNWLWDFGDGTTSTEQNPTHTYAYGNNYPVSLTVSNDGGSNSITQTIPVYGDMARWDLFGGQIKDVIYLILIIPIGLVGYFIIRLFSNEDVDGNTLIMVAVFALVIIISAGILLAILGALSHVA